MILTLVDFDVDINQQSFQVPALPDFRGQRDLHAPVYTMSLNDFAALAYNMPCTESIAILQSQPSM